ncbi:hypothetical protein GCM10022212_08510 [Actimicrobium antarcticum]|uniref:Uncharacterized protein n=1 Tax=Actimicrobium antarcticum TaxID=1051899 RepID=A0ABP7SSM8_9BURK
MGEYADDQYKWDVGEFFELRGIASDDRSRPKLIVRIGKSAIVIYVWFRLCRH